MQSPTKDHLKYGFSFQLEEGLYANLPNPFRGILVVAGAGSGKSETFANTLIGQAVAKDYCGIVYDFKYPALTRQLRGAGDLFKTKTKIVSINFADPGNSNRVNPLHPRYIKSLAYAEEYATAIINNLMPESIQRTDFWVRSSIAILQAGIWFYREERPESCNLPNIVKFLQSDPEDFLTSMRRNLQCERLLSSILTAFDRQAGNQLAGTVGTLQLALNKISTPEIAWVLSGDEFDLELNKDEAPVFMALGNTPGLADTYSPVLSLIASVAIKMMNGDKACKRHSLVLLDEAPTLYIPRLEILPATGRSNKIAVAFICQDFSQIIDRYGFSKKETIISNLANQFYGRVSNVQTAEYISKLFGRRDVLVESHSKSAGTGVSSGSRSQGYSSVNRGQSRSYNWQERTVLKPQAIFGFRSGQFASMIVERDEGLASLFVGNYRMTSFFTQVV